jgi:hypothetical protein
MSRKTKKKARPPRPGPTPREPKLSTADQSNRSAEVTFATATTQSCDENESAVSEFGREAAPEVARRGDVAIPSKFEAALQSGAVLSETTHSIIRGLIDFAYEQQERNFRGLNRLLACRSPFDLIELQRELLRDNIKGYGLRVLTGE